MTILKHYLEKIKSNETKSNSLNYVSHLQSMHLNTFPFEGINPFTQTPVPIDLSELNKKFLNQQRGGYCFEQNLFFKSILEESGFNVKSYLGRVIEKNAHAGRTHLINIIEIEDQSYLIDVGFGGLNPPAPILLGNNVITETNLNTYRLVQEETAYILQVWKNREWKNLYSFDFNHYTPMDFEVANWYTSTSPKASFTQHLMVCIVRGNQRLNLKNNLFSVLENSQIVEKKKIETIEELESLLKTHFKIDPTYLINWKEKVQVLFE